jgi:hypothetical protein
MVLKYTRGYCQLEAWTYATSTISHHLLLEHTVPSAVDTPHHNDASCCTPYSLRMYVVHTCLYTLSREFGEPGSRTSQTSPQSKHPFTAACYRLCCMWQWIGLAGLANIQHVCSLQNSANVVRQTAGHPIYAQNVISLWDLAPHTLNTCQTVSSATPHLHPTTVVMQPTSPNPPLPKTCCMHIRSPWAAHNVCLAVCHTMCHTVCEKGVMMLVITSATVGPAANKALKA